MRVTSFAGSAYIVTMSVSMFTRWYTMKKKKKVNATRVTCFVVNAYVVTISRQNKQN